MFNPHVVLQILPFEQKLLDSISMNVTVIEGLFFFVTLLALNWCLYYMGKQEGYKMAKLEAKKIE